jgi:rod shape-determining protein MreD
MKYILWGLIIFLAFFLQARISVLGIPPNLTVVLAYYAGIKYGEKGGLFLGVLIGALEDGLSSSIVGPNLLAKGLIGYSSAFFITGRFFRWTPFLGMMALSFLSIVDNSVVFISRTIFDKMPAAPSAALLMTVMQSVLNSLAGMVIRPRHVD